jgi:hypothetical protein
VLIRLESRFRTRDDALHPLALARGDTGLEKGRVDAEAAGEPLDGLAGGPGLPALDLADVFLGETLAGELGLRQPASDAELAYALAHRVAGGPLGGADGGELIVHLR